VFFLTGLKGCKVRLVKAACQNEAISNGCELSVCIEIQASAKASIFKTSPWSWYLKIDYGGDAEWSAATRGVFSQLVKSGKSRYFIDIHHGPEQPGDRDTIIVARQVVAAASDLKWDAQIQEMDEISLRRSRSRRTEAYIENGMARFGRRCGHYITLHYSRL
jgi:hypothetical protein